ncbi:MAG: glycosyltransferase family 2 protein [Flavobacterium sp.]
MNTFSKNKISGLVITFNEENHIEELINNLNFVDELIILDSFSTDKTVEIIKSYSHVTLIQNKFEDYTKQRNLALSYANHNWILFLDADERIPDALRDEIIKTVNSPVTKNAYYFVRKFMYKNKPLHFSGWQTDKNFRLFKKDKASYISTRLVHETLHVQGHVGILKHKLIHYSFSDYTIYKNKMISYGKLRAKELFLQQKKTNLIQLYLKPVYKFLYDYVIRLGILDGKKGIIICYLNTLSIYVRYKELKKLNNNLNRI